MVTVQHVVRRELAKNPFLTEVLGLGLANVSAVANYIETSVEKELGKSVKYSAIGMAIRRYMEQVPYKSVFDFTFHKDLDISTKADIYEIAIERTSLMDKAIFDLRKKFKRKKGDFLSIIEGEYEIAFYTNQKNKLFLKKALRNYMITSEREKLSYVAVNFSRETKDIAGIYYHITRSLAYRGVSIQSLQTIGSEMTIFVKSEMLVEALNTLVVLLKNSKL